MNSGLEQIVTRSLPGVSTMLRSILRHRNHRGRASDPKGWGMDNQGGLLGGSDI